MDAAFSLQQPWRLNSPFTPKCVLLKPFCMKRNARATISPVLRAALPDKSPSLCLNLDLGSRPAVQSAIAENINNCLTETYLEGSIPRIGPRQRGKVRDVYELDDSLVLVTTDRQSAFDRVLASVPFKGQVLNLTSAWWFRNTDHITPNAVLSIPDPNVTVFRKLHVFPVEFVVRGFITGTTSTSLWTVYKNGSRNYCGNPLKEGLRKNEKLENNILTPTTKAVDHDEPVSPQEIVERKLMTSAEWEDVSQRALKLFQFGQEVASSRGLLLVDTKYEFGKDEEGNIFLIDEIHTPDSSRYWIHSTYEERFAQGLEPQNIDKEFLRLWFRDNCDPYNDQELPEAPKELVTELSWRYIFLFEAITGQQFEFPTKEPIHERIVKNVASFFS